LRGEVLSNCHGCGWNDEEGCEPVNLDDEGPSSEWFRWNKDDAMSVGGIAMPPKTATGCPAWKAKTDNNEKG
jgi:hypothetical protein